MYYPFLRGRQNELFALSALLGGLKNTMPIVEPTNFSWNSQYKNYADNELEFILVVNPRNPKPGVTASEINTRIIEKYFKDSSYLNIGILILASTRLRDVEAYLEKFGKNFKITLIHLETHSDPPALLKLINGYKNVNRHVFDDDGTSAAYQLIFSKDGRLRVLLKDSFGKKTRNVDYPTTPYLFSDIHKTYSTSYDGFGDFTITGNYTREGGGPALAVTIHFSFVQGRSNIHMHHFISDRTTGTSDPAGKFKEANRKLNTFVSGTVHEFGDGAEGFLDCHRRKHFPGLGYSKRLSIIRHVEVYTKLI